MSFVLIGDRVFTSIFKKIVFNSKTKFALIYKGEIKKDVLILGNSRGVSSFCPDDINLKTNKSVFQLSYKGMSMEIASCLFEDYIENNEAPKILVLESSCLDSKNDLIHNIKAYSIQKSKLTRVFKKEAKGFYYLSKIFNTIYFNNGEILFSSLWFKNFDDQNIIKAKTGIFNLNLHKNEKYSNSVYSDKSNLAALQNIVNLCNKNNIKLKLVFSPFLLPATNETINSIEGLKNLIFGDYEIFNYRNLTLSYQFFVDSNHLNYLGSIKLLDYLIADELFN